MNVKAATAKTPDHAQMEWQAISTAPFDRELELAVLDRGGVHALVFPCRRVLRGWINSTREPVNVHPTHWRDWSYPVSSSFSRSGS
jgi:hypothetical protein